MSWLAVSIVLSIALTVAVNVALRLFPGTGGRLARGLEDLATRQRDDPDTSQRVRVFVPWKAMIVGSLVLTLVLNVALWIR